MSESTGYRFRLTSATRTPGLLRVQAAETSLVLPDGRTLFIVARNEATLSSATKLHFEAGSYDTREEAMEAGNRLRLRLRLLDAALALGLDVPRGDSLSGSVAKAKKEEAKQVLGIELMDNIWGLLVFPDDEKHAEFVMHASASVNPSDSTYWLSALRELWESTFELDERSEDAVGLLGLAALEGSPRSQFLVTYLALERLIPTRERGETALELIERLKACISKAARRNNKPISARDESSLLSALGRLHYESVGNALTRLALENEHKEIEGEPILDFIKQCITTRHATAHPGNTDPTVDLTKLSRGLRQITMGVLWGKHGIPDLTIPIPGSQVSFEAGALQAQVLTYKQR